MPAELSERLTGECLCGDDGWRDHLRCAKTEWCANGGVRDVTITRPASDAVLMAVLSGDAPAQLAGVIRLRRSASAVNSRLPFHAILTDVSGATLARVESERIVAHRWPAPRPPPWAHAPHRPSFAKLLLFNASAALGGRTIIYLDTDVVLLQSIDMLAAAPTPAFVFKKKELLNSGVAVLRATPSECDALWRHYSEMSRSTYRRQRDGGDQEVLLNFWESRRTVVHELPIEFNAYGWEMNHTALPPWWLHTRVAHKLPGITPMPASHEAAWRNRVPPQARRHLVARSKELLGGAAEGEGSPPAATACRDIAGCCRRHPAACAAAPRRSQPTTTTTPAAAARCPHAPSSRACTTGQWVSCGGPSSRYHWSGAAPTCSAWRRASSGHLRSVLLQLPRPSILFWGDSTFRQLYIDAGLLLASNGGFDEPECRPEQEQEVEHLGPGPRAASEAVLFDNFTSMSKSTVLRDGCLVRSSRRFEVALSREDAARSNASTAAVQWHGSGRLHCPRGDPTVGPSLYAQLRAGGCPGAIVTGHNLWDCRWVRKAGARWPDYSYAGDVREATRAVSALCPRTVKLWRTSNALELSSKHSNAWRDLPACLRNNECEADRALAAGWRVLDSYGVTATPQTLRRQGLALHASADERHLGAAATRAVMSSVLAALAS